MSKRTNMVLLSAFVLLLLFFVFSVLQLANLESLQADQERIAGMFDEDSNTTRETAHSPFWKGFLIGGALGAPIMMVYILYRLIKAKN